MTSITEGTEAPTRTKSPTGARGSKAVLGLIGWLLVCNLAGFVGAFVTDSSSPWFLALEKPEFNPPPWVFAPVWTTLYVLMGVAAWRVWRHWGWGGARIALGLFIVQLALNAAWSPVFFGARDPRLALIIIGSLAFALALTIATFWRKDRLAALLLVPYLAWVSFATALNYAFVTLNPNA